MKLLFLGASNTDCDHCFSKDNLGYGYVKMVHDLLQKKRSECNKIFDDPLVVVNGGTDGFTFPRIYQKWKMTWQGTAFDAVFLLGGINEVGALMDSGMDEASHQKLLRHSSDALTSLLSDLPRSNCRKIFVLEPFLFDTPQYLKSWMRTLAEVQQMIRQTVTAFPPASVRLLETQSFLDEAAQNLGLLEVTKDGIHLAQMGHFTLAEIIVALICKEGLLK